MDDLVAGENRYVDATCASRRTIRKLIQDENGEFYVRLMPMIEGKRTPVREYVVGKKHGALLTSPRGEDLKAWRISDARASFADAQDIIDIYRDSKIFNRASFVRKQDAARATLAEYGIDIGEVITQDRGSDAAHADALSLDARWGRLAQWNLTDYQRELLAEMGA